jgi:hypothetical protein
MKSRNGPIDNKVAENGIRPFVIGHKACLFSNTQRGEKCRERYQ